VPVRTSRTGSPAQTKVLIQASAFVSDRSSEPRLPLHVL
jgi:hypothetical protein